MSGSCLSYCTVLSSAAVIFIPPIALSSFSFILQCGQKSVITNPNHSYQCDKIICFAVFSPRGSTNIMLTFFFLFFLPTAWVFLGCVTPLALRPFKKLCQSEQHPFWMYDKFTSWIPQVLLLQLCFWHSLPEWYLNRFSLTSISNCSV